MLGLIGFIYEVMLIVENQELEGKHTTFVEAVCFALTNNLVTNLEDDTLPPLRSEKLMEQTVKEVTDTQTNNADQENAETTSTLGVADAGVNTKLSKKSMSLDADVGMLQSRKLRPALNVPPNNWSMLRERYILKRLKSELKMSIDIESDKLDTDKYMYGALYACIGMLLWKHRWIIYILMVPTAFYIIKQFGKYFGLWKMIQSQCNIFMEIIKTWCIERHQALLPANVRGLYKVGIIIDKKLTQALKVSVDTVATIAVILGLVIFTTCATIFITIQVLHT